MAARVKLRVLEGEYGVARLQASEAIPAWADGGGFVSISRTDDELSIVCRKDRIPRDVQFDAGWSCFKFQGPFAFDETGIVLSVIEPLSTNDIGIFVVSTFDGDHLLLKTGDLEKAFGLLANAGHSLIKESI
ncbi:ACT domain-containing protein [Agrobacterium tumefaciens]|nr:ACT domain-containing protein [Agrobacterium tumefaciens]TQN62607.1 ACT domain-containing protein [Agrobacterium tumefaciens]